MHKKVKILHSNNTKEYVHQEVQMLLQSKVKIHQTNVAYYTYSRTEWEGVKRDMGESSRSTKDNDFGSL